MFYDDDADLTLLDGKTVAIIGFGSQGHAHALNLKDSGVDVVVGLRDGSASVEKARSAGLEVTGIADAASRGDIVMVLLPDEKHGEVWRAEIADGVAPGNLLLFGHGFSIHYDGHAYVLVHLDQVGEQTLRELIEDAWRCRAPDSLQ